MGMYFHTCVWNNSRVFMESPEINDFMVQFGIRVFFFKFGMAGDLRVGHSRGGVWGFVDGDGCGGDGAGGGGDVDRGGGVAGVLGEAKEGVGG